MLPNIKATIYSAIRNKRTLLIRYKKQSKARVIEPHILYRSTKGYDVLVGYQTRGYSSRGRSSAFWRPFKVNSIQSIYVVDEIYNPRSSKGYETVSALIKGAIEIQVSTQNTDYNHFCTEIHGPPTPSYLQTQSGYITVNNRPTSLQ